MSEGGDASAQRRRVQWLYLLPVAGAPVAHLFVTATAQFPKRRRVLLALVAGATVTAVLNRLWLMGDAGYPGYEGSKGRDRYEQRGSDK
jgi:hypothetical protein